MPIVPYIQRCLVKNCRLLLPLLLFLTGSCKVSAQSIAYYRAADCVFNTSTDISNGCTSSNYFTFQFSGFSNGNNYAAGWTVRVKANGNFSNGSTTIAPQYVALGFASINGGPTGVTGTGYKTLSTSGAVNLIATSSALQTPPTYFFEHRFNLQIQPGAPLAVGTGTYSTTLTVTLVDRNGITIASKNDVPISFVVNYNNSCTGATIASYTSNQYTFSNYPQQMAGASVTDAATIQYTPNNASCSGWSLKVRAAGNFTNGANSVLPQYLSLRFNRVSSGTPTASAIGVTNNPVALNTTDVTLINQSAAGFVPGTGTEHKFDLIIQGGNHLLLPNGTYTGTLVFTLYNQSNQVVSTSTVTLSFAINSNTNSYTLVFQNAADNINLGFNTIADYVNGVSVNKNNGIRITAYSPYQVVIKTSATNFTHTGGTSVIPVSVVNLAATKSSTTSGGINVYTRQLSASDQVLIYNPMIDYTQQVVEYNLRYFTTPGDKRLSLPSGSFNTSVFFVVIPQ
jgi:hypothetical protein